MDAIKTLTLIGGISRGSLNRCFFEAVKTLGLEDFQFDDFEIAKLPFYSQDLENEPPDIVTAFKDKIREADAVLVVTPEYNRSYPGVLKNAIDWGSRPYGQNLWDRKPAALVGASPGNIGTFGAQHHLRQVFAYLNVYVMGQPEFYFNASRAFNEAGAFASEGTRDFVVSFFRAFREHVELLNAAAAAGKFRSLGLKDSPLAPPSPS
jgi:chromate reductase